ncbi:hypothetical protein [Paucidesulfovibrio longus]|uniref:hypothetical protein n=1 Tax=Paucidesulfovibrio longus TaxID=889 RepID=UPI0004092B1F|nr:hypothetical protein [Paucidesulfovibrio longus]
MTSFSAPGKIEQLCISLAARICDSRTAPWALAALWRCTKRVFNDSIADFVALKVINLLGYLFFKRGIVWNNFHIDGLRARFESKKSPFRTIPKRTPTASPALRIGVVTRRVDMGFPECYESQFPQPHQLYLFDTVVDDGPHRPAPARPDIHCVRVEQQESYQKFIRELAERINAAQLDILILANWCPVRFNQPKRDLASLVDTPCLIGYLSGSDLIYHPKVDYSLYVQPRKGYSVKNQRLWSHFARGYVRAERCYETVFTWPSYEIKRAENPPFSQRSNIILSMNRLYKVAQTPYLTAITTLLQRDKSLRFVFLGEDNAQHLESISSFFRRSGVASQVQYLGAFSLYLPKEQLTDKIFTLLRAARLAPDPWPIGGGRTRIEAYSAGTPSTHMRLDHTPTTLWNRDSQKGTDLPCLELPEATATTLDEFISICSRLLYDKEAAESIVRKQYRIVDHVTSPSVWWEEVLSSHDQWLHGTGWASDFAPALKD